MALLCAIGLGACGSTRAPAGAPSPDAGTASTAVSTLFDAGTVYGSMGLLVAGPPLPFVATVQYLADATPDSTLALFAMSLSNHALAFQRDGRGYAAQYHVDVAFRGDSGTGREFATDESVRVGTFQETQRADESVIYQRIIGVPPGVYHVYVTVRDRSGPAASHRERTDTVPRFTGAGLSAPIAVYQAAGRGRPSEVPTLLVNPRATLSYGVDSLRFYVEAYGVKPGTRLSARAVDPAGRDIWHDTLALRGSETL
ncbi:MAG TPA: hypothetical protein VH137_02270, partial [Gemmatimonadales bacterium]|nr:hypothetical protein [Gemmatimonadales bacterium]